MKAIPLALLFLPFLCLKSTGTAPKIVLDKIASPIIFKGDSVTAYRDPTAIFFQDTLRLFFTLVEIEQDGKIFSYTAKSTTTDLIQWSKPTKITPRNQRLNFCSPGNIITFKQDWILCLQSYPRPNYISGEAVRYGDQTARIFITKSKDLNNWSAPELLLVKGPEIPEKDMGRMIDPYLIEDKDEPGKWWCFYKQNGVSMSYSYDLKNWSFFGRTASGENVCVLVRNNEYVLFHSPRNGIAMKYSSDLLNWKYDERLITLDQKKWPWAQGRLTAGFVLDMRNIPGVNKYVMFFHGSGPEDESKMFDNYASLGIAWSTDLFDWDWPDKK